MSNEKQKRSSKQNRALHKWCSMMAEALNDAGFDLVEILLDDPTCPDCGAYIGSLGSKIDIPWTKEIFKDRIWRRTQATALGIESTAECETADYPKVYEILNRHFSENYGLSVPWPSDEPPIPGEKPC
jgi:hypothetical protein